VYFVAHDAKILPQAGRRIVMDNFRRGKIGFQTDISSKVQDNVSATTITQSRQQLAGLYRVNS